MKIRSYDAIKKFIFFCCLFFQNFSYSGTLYDIQYIKIQFDAEYGFKLGSNFCNIYPKKQQNKLSSIYQGICTNTISISAPSPVMIQISLMDHTLTDKDQLKVYMNPSKSGLSRCVTLWDGKNQAFEEQLAREIEGSDQEYRIKFEYIGDDKTIKTEKDALITFTLVASETI